MRDVAQQHLVVHLALRANGAHAVAMDGDDEPLPAAFAVLVVQVGDAAAQRAVRRQGAKPNSGLEMPT